MNYNFHDYLYESDSDEKSERAQLFARAKSIALAMAKSKNRSTASISSADNASELENATSHWEDSKDEKIKSAYNRIKNILKTKAKISDTENDEKKDTETEVDDTENTENDIEKTDTETEVDDTENTENDIEKTDTETDDERDDSTKKEDIQKMDAEDEKNVMKSDDLEKLEYSRKKEESDIYDIKEKLTDIEDKKIENIKSLSNFLDTLLNLFSDYKSDLNLDNAEKRVETNTNMIGTIADTLNTINSHESDMEKDFLTKLEAQDKIQRDELENIKKEYSPKIAEYEEKRKANINKELKEKLKNDYSLRMQYERYQELSKKRDFLSEDEKKELGELENGDVGNMLNSLNDKYKALSDAEKDSLNKAYRKKAREDKLKSSKEKKRKLRDEYNEEVKKFKESTKDLTSELEKLSKNVGKRDFTQEDLKKLKDMYMKFQNKYE